jgi:hypothetical protein
VSDEFTQSIFDELLPKMQGSRVVASIVPRNEGDLKFIVELGLAIMLDKPIALIIQPGRPLPEHLARVADVIIEYGPAMGEALAEFARGAA